MIGRFLATCGWLAWQVGRRASGLKLPVSDPARAAATGAGIALLVLALVPLVLPLFDAQPQDVTVQRIMDGEATEAGGWVRLSARSVVRLDETPTGEEGSFAILADARNPLRSIVVQGDVRTAIASLGNVTGRLADAAVVVDVEMLPIEATVAGTPPVIVADQIVNLDSAPVPARRSLWPLSLIPLVLGAMFLIGARVGYPIFRETFEIDVLSSPLGPGERLPAAFGGHVGPNERNLADPGAALLLVRRGPKGNVLTAQPLAEEAGPPPAAVAIGGGWTSGRTGYVHTVTESVPALTIKSDEVDATFLFANVRERDRVAALVAVAR
ncbi:MAG TPA: hypothetical protein VIH24_09365 [Candidatus Limnocylindria bacterium]